MDGRRRLVVAQMAHHQRMRQNAKRFTARWSAADQLCQILIIGWDPTFAIELTQAFVRPIPILKEQLPVVARIGPKSIADRPLK